MTVRRPDTFGGGAVQESSSPTWIAAKSSWGRTRVIRFAPYIRQIVSSGFASTMDKIRVGIVPLGSRKPFLFHCASVPQTLPFQPRCADVRVRTKRFAPRKPFLLAQLVAGARIQARDHDGVFAREVISRDVMILLCVVMKVCILRLSHLDFRVRLA